MQASTMATEKSSKCDCRDTLNASALAWALSGLVLVTMVFVVFQILLLEGGIVVTPSQVTSSTTSSSIRIADRKIEVKSIQFVSHIDEETRLRSKRRNKEHRPVMTNAIFDESTWDKRNEMFRKAKKVKPNECGYSKGILQLTEEEADPQAGDRHMVTPPQGGNLDLVCCETTKGNLAIAVHHKWAPIGAKHFMDMIQAKYFDTTVPMMRCIKDFLCQFGINSDPNMSKKFPEDIKDDPNWLPEGPDFRENKQGVQRFAQGYLAYAGGGKNTRGNQLIMSLKADGYLAGGSPWEVPWGELVGKESFETLSKFYTGYDDNGPDQGDLTDRGMDAAMRKKFPLIDYINKCVLVDQRTI